MSELHRSDERPVARINPATLDRIGPEGEEADAFVCEDVEYRIVRSESVAVGDTELEGLGVLHLNDMPQA